MISPQVPCKDSTQLVEEGEADSVLPVPAAPHELVDVAGLARERLRRATEGNEADAQQVVMAEQRLSDMAAEMRGLEDQFSQHQRRAEEARAKLEMESTQREKKASRREAEVAAATAALEADRDAQLQQRVKAKVQLKELKHEVTRLEEMLKEVLNAKKRVELKAKAAAERQREKERERLHGKQAEREREARELGKEEARIKREQRRGHLAQQAANLGGGGSGGVGSGGAGGGAGAGDGGGSPSGDKSIAGEGDARKRIEELAARLDEPAPTLASPPAPKPQPDAAAAAAGGLGGAGPGAADKPALGLGRPRDSAVRPMVSASDAASTAAELVANAGPKVSDSGLNRRPLGAIGGGGALPANPTEARAAQRALTPEKAGDIHTEVGDLGSPVTKSPAKKPGGLQPDASPSKMSASGEPVDEYDDDFDDDFEEEELSES